MWSHNKLSQHYIPLRTSLPPYTCQNGEVVYNTPNLTTYGKLEHDFVRKQSFYGTFCTLAYQKYRFKLWTDLNWVLCPQTTLKPCSD